MESYLARLTVADIMQTNTVSLSPETGLFEALGTCRQQGVDIALVMKAGTLVGTIGLQDIMRGLWSEEYSSKTSLTVADLMCAEFTAVRPCLKVNQLIETLVVNKEVLFNV
ncbi:MAG: CBS domain-containing protein, partial [Shewanella sp.]